MRALKNSFTKEFLKKEYDSAVSNEELEHFGAGALRRAAREGDEKTGCFMAGQIAALVNQEQTAAEIIQQLLAETEQILCGAMKWVR